VVQLRGFRVLVLLLCFRNKQRSQWFRAIKCLNDTCTQAPDLYVEHMRVFRVIGHDRFTYVAANGFESV
jgi:hypothetical protein